MFTFPYDHTEIHAHTHTESEAFIPKANFEKMDPPGSSMRDDYCLYDSSRGSGISLGTTSSSTSLRQDGMENQSCDDGYPRDEENLEKEAANNADYFKEEHKAMDTPAGDEEDEAHDEAHAYDEAHDEAHAHDEALDEAYDTTFYTLDKTVFFDAKEPAAEANTVFVDKSPMELPSSTATHSSTQTIPAPRGPVRGVDPPEDARHIHTEQLEQRSSSAASITTAHRLIVAALPSREAVSAPHDRQYTREVMPQPITRAEEATSVRPVDFFVPTGEAAASVPDVMTTSIGSDAFLALIREGFPAGLVQEMLDLKASFPHHHWVIDNSGSMLNSDCVRFVPAGPRGKTELIKCNRWSELQCTVESHAHLAGLLKTKTIFRLLNKPMANGALREFTVSRESDVELAKTVIRSTEPEGVTPLTQHILEIRERIAQIEEDLLANGQTAVVVIATDGIPSDEYGESPEEVRKEFTDALRALQLLPVWIVIRLCTSERKVLKFYRRIDKQLERPLDCISNYLNEAKEIQKWNSWLNYALPLHRVREMGNARRIFDILDERELTKDELREFLDLIFGKPSLENAPDIHSDWKGFYSFLVNVVSREGQQWSPHSKKMEDWIDLRKLNLIYGGGIVNSFRRRLSDLREELREAGHSSKGLFEGTTRGDLLPVSKKVR